MERKLSRKRLRPWLENHCNNNTFRGLRWLDKEKKIFLITWKHQHNRGWDAVDAEIFKAWAIFSGKHREGETDDYPSWKTRLRTALTKLTDIQEMKELHDKTDPENPYRAYRFLDEETSTSNSGTPQGSPWSVSTVSPGACSSQASPASQIDVDNETSGVEPKCHPEKSYAFKMDPTIPNNIPTVVSDEDSMSSMNDIVIVSDGVQNDFNILPQDATQAQVVKDSNIPATFQQETVDMGRYNVNEAPMPSDLASIDSGNLVHMIAQSIEDNNCNISIESSLPSMSSLEMPPIPTWEVKVFFVDHMIIREKVAGNGARLFCGDLMHQSEIVALVEDYNVFGPANMKQIPIPGIYQMEQQPPISEKQKELIHLIQRNMDRGLLVGGTKTQMFAHRLCKARVFAWTQEKKSERLDRENNNPVCVFDLEIFNRQMDDYLMGGGPQPSTSVIFTFGQEYTADSLDTNRTLFFVKVTHIEADDILQKQDRMKNKNTIPDILISDSNSMDHLVEKFKEMGNIK